MTWANNPNRKQESLFTIPIIQMGQRIYLPTLGRFLQTDPIEGGTLNPYVYAHDPVNLEDYSGEQVAQTAGGGLVLGSVCWFCGAVYAAVVAVGYTAGAVYDAYQSRSKASSTPTTQTQVNNWPIKRGYTPTTSIGLQAINAPTASHIASKPTSATARGVVYVVGQLTIGNKPTSTTGGIPLFDWKPPSKSGPLRDDRFSMMAKYSYRYFDVPSGQTLEFHYFIDDIKREYAELKDISIK